MRNPIEATDGAEGVSVPVAVEALHPVTVVIRGGGVHPVRGVKGIGGMGDLTRLRDHLKGMVLRFRDVIVAIRGNLSSSSSPRFR